MSSYRSSSPFDFVSENLVELRQNHYMKYLGPMDEKVFHSTDEKAVHIDIFQFKPTKVRDYWTLITGGMSDRRQYAPEEMESFGSRAEILMYVKKPQKWMFRVLKGLAEMPFKEQTFLSWYHTVPNGKPMTAKASELTSFLFLPPYFEDPDFDEMFIEGDKVNILWMVPITEKERQFAMLNGGEALEELFMEAHLDLVVNEARKSLV